MIYRDFARLYATGDYPKFSAHIAEILPSVLKQLRFQPTTILDLACGEGTFAITMAKNGFKVTGLDKSSEMLSFAKKKARAENVAVNFAKMDIRQLELDTTFDLVTCWFDSLNYLLELEDLESTFTAVEQHLKPKGLFIFDVNTIFWLTTLAQRYPAIVEKDTNDIFQVHRHSYNADTHIATFQITGFLKENGLWTRQVEEIHHERGYTLEEIRSCLLKAKLTEVASWGNLEERLPITKDSKRAWFVTRKG